MKKKSAELIAYEGIESDIATAAGELAQKALELGDENSYEYHAAQRLLAAVVITADQFQNQVKAHADELKKGPWKEFAGEST